jgi:hypothetical protein
MHVLEPSLLAFAKLAAASTGPDMIAQMSERKLVLSCLMSQLNMFSFCQTGTKEKEIIFAWREHLTRVTNALCRP